MNAWLKLGCIIVLVFFAMWCMRKIIETTFNLYALWYEKKLLGSLPRTSGNIVFNKKTGKLEETPGKVILPFD